ncbi:hypothetical protein TWF718_008567 [Orbilia javanica]|uniref:Dynamin N-terminal domain-containing protein n=1 Tax=Orbilia javanica TaxID=47235 RepID=A0AAN8MXY2_9PEZI
MRAIIHDVGGTDSDVSLNTPPATEAEGIALAKIKALFPDLASTADVLRRVKELYSSHQYLIAGTHILETSSKPEAVDYMRSLAPFAGSGHETALWPLVKVVKLYLDSDALKTGAILVDLPGLRDSNAARTAVTRQYMNRANEIVVVTRLTRAVTDETTGELSREGYMKRLKHDGRKHLTIVCTCSDNFEPNDAAEDFNGDKQFLEKYHSLNREIETLYSFIDCQKPGSRREVAKQDLSSLETSLQQLCIEARDKHAVNSISETYSKLLSGDTSINCYVTSAKHYLEHYLPRKKSGIMSVDQTQIPMLRDYCASAPLEQKSALAAQFVRNIWGIQALARELASNDATGMSRTSRQEARAEMDRASGALLNSLNSESLIFATNIQNDVQIFMEGLAAAIAKGEEYCLELHQKTVKENNFPAIKSAYLHHGESTTGKLKNLNEQFLFPLGAEIDRLWKAFISKTEGHLQAWNFQVLRSLEDFETSWQGKARLWMW